VEVEAWAEAEVEVVAWAEVSAEVDVEDKESKGN